MMTVEVCVSQFEKEACIILNTKKERRPRFVISVVEAIIANIIKAHKSHA